MKIEEKRKKIKKFAESIGVCNVCLRREAKPGRTACSICLAKNKQHSDRMRHKEGHCSRCGRINKDTGHRTCDYCRGYMKKYNNK